MEQQSFIYNFLLTPQFRIWRYFALIVFFVIISLNQALSGYEGLIPYMGKQTYWMIIVGTIVIYIATVYIGLRKMSKYLLSGKYLQFVVCIILYAFLFQAIPNIVYILHAENYNLLSESVLVDNLSAFVIYILCISGVIIPVFLKNWIISNQHLSQLKIKQKSSQVEQLKEQINPRSFLKILNKSKTLVTSEPDKASSMLMMLGRLLRYQLYDSNRSQVLLTAEISFLRNFLELEKLYSSGFNYTLNLEGNMNGIFIPASVLLPYIQSIVNSYNGENGTSAIDIRIDREEENINISVFIKGIDSIDIFEKELLRVKERLDTLCKDSYSLIITDKQTVVLQLG